MTLKPNEFYLEYDHVKKDFKRKGTIDAFDAIRIKGVLADIVNNGQPRKLAIEYAKQHKDEIGFIVIGKEVGRPFWWGGIFYKINNGKAEISSYKEFSESPEGRCSS